MRRGDLFCSRLRARHPSSLSPPRHLYWTLFWKTLAYHVTSTKSNFFLSSLIACSHSRGDSHPLRCARLTSSAPVFSLSCSHAPLSFIPSLITVIQCFISDALALASYIRKESRVHEEPTLSLLPQHEVSDTFALHTHSKCPGENWAAVTTFQVIAQALHLISKARAAHPKGHIAKN